MSEDINPDSYVGDCYVCGIGIFKRSVGNDHYIVLPYTETQKEQIARGELLWPNVRCAGCAPGTTSWLDSPLGKASKYKTYFETGREEARERRQSVTVQRKARAGIASPLLKSFAGRIKYFVHMLKVSGDKIPWVLELVDNGKYYYANYDGDTLTIEAGGTSVAFEPKDSLLDRLKLT